MLEVTFAAACLSVLVGVAILRRLTRVEEKLDKLERVGVLMTSERELSPAARPMSPRERIRWVERRINGTQRATT